MTPVEQLALWVGLVASLITLVQTTLLVARWVLTPRKTEFHESVPEVVEPQPAPTAPLTHDERDELEYWRWRGRRWRSLQWQANFAAAGAAGYLAILYFYDPQLFQALVLVISDIVYAVLKPLAP